MPIPAPSIPPIPSSSGLVLAVLAFAAMALAGCLIGLPPRDAERGTRTTTTTTAPAPRQERPADTLPSWVHQPPTDAHLAYGVGASLDHRSDRAIIEARRDLAKRLNIVIHGVPQAEADSGADEAAADPDRAPVDVDFLELPVIEVVRQEDTTTCTYVLISLDRSVWAERLGRRLDHLNRQIRETLAVLQAQPEVAETRPIATVARQHQRLLPFLTERALRVRQLKVADPGAVPPHPPVTLTALQERLAQVLDPVTVEIVAPPDLEPIMPQLVAGCARLGLKQADNNNADPVLRLRLQLTLTQREADGFDNQEGVFECVTELARNGRQIGALSVTLRSTSNSNAATRERLLRKIVARWSDYLEGDFVGCLTNL